VTQEEIRKLRAEVDRAADRLFWVALMVALFGRPRATDAA
jgi:hypothetical protein